MTAPTDTTAAAVSAAEDVIQLHMPAHDKSVYLNTSALIAAEAPDFPSFLFSERELHRATKVFRKGFDGLLTYAVKCNPSPHIIKQLHEEGLKASTSSPTPIWSPRATMRLARRRHQTTTRSRTSADRPRL